MKMMTIPEHCVRPCGAECQRCAIACPVGAISYDPETQLPMIDHEACTKCGVCMGACDAFSSDATTSLQLYDHLRRVAMRGEAVYLTCQENVFPGFQPAKNVTVLPCLACMPPELWTVLLAQNMPLCLACDLSYCETCTRAPGRGGILFTRAIEMAEEQTGRAVRFDREIPELEDALERAAEHESDRREAFANMKDDAVDILSGKRRLRQSETLKDAYRRKERQRMQSALNLTEGEIINRFAEGGRSSRSMQPRRRMLLEAMVAQPDVAARTKLVISATNHNRCVECMDCTQVCPTGARMVSPEDGTLAYDARYCIACGACANACPKDAVDFIEILAVDLMPEGPGKPAVEPEA